MDRAVDKSDPLAVTNDVPPTPAVDVAQPGVVEATRDPATPSRIATVGSLWTRPVRWVVTGVVLIAALAYVLFGTVLARNVTYNMSGAIDPGASNGIPRYSRETITSVWRTMWDKAPDFGSIDATRAILLVATVAFFLAFAAVLMLVFVPGQREWAASLADRQDPDRAASE